ncbi:MAG: hypothetical protein OXN79_13735 [bacterium]|nr:hypothetical protein [bacterium]
MTDDRADGGEDLVDSEDIEQLRHEILRLRDQAIGAEVQGRYLRARVTELEDRIAERDARIDEWKDRVLERDTRIAERDTRIAERDTRIAERDARIAERDAEILCLHKDLARPAIIRIARRLARRPSKDAPA